MNIMSCMFLSTVLNAIRLLKRTKKKSKPSAHIGLPSVQTLRICGRCIRNSRIPEIMAIYFVSFKMRAIKSPTPLQIYNDVEPSGLVIVDLTAFYTHGTVKFPTLETDHQQNVNVGLLVQDCSGHEWLLRNVKHNLLHVVGRQVYRQTGTQRQTPRGKTYASF